jgi:hypothetical protein
MSDLDADELQLKSGDIRRIGTVGQQESRPRSTAGPRG